MLKKCIDRLRGSLTLRIFLITALILAAACGVTYSFLLWATPISYTSILNSELEDRARNLVGSLEETTLEDCGPLLDRFIVDTGADLMVTDSSGRLVDLPTSVAYVISQADEEDVVITSVEIAAGAAEAGEQSVYAAESRSTTVENSVAFSSGAQSYTFSFAGDETIYTLSILGSVKAANQTAEALDKVLPLMILLVLGVSLLGAVFYSRYITRPIVRLSGISQKMAGLDFTWRCREKRLDEIGVLGRNLDLLSASLSAALADLQAANAALRLDIDRERELESQRTAFFSAASHELKTPITVLKGQLSGMLAGVDIYQDRDKYLARSLAVTNRMEALVQEILAVSRMERADFSLSLDPVDLSALVRRQVELIGDLAEQREQRLDVQICPGLAMPGDGALLGKAVSNLLSNAVVYSPKGETVWVRLWEEQGEINLTVENSGARIPEQAIPHLFEAFFRVDSSRNRETGGSGLGLYLVKLILDRHGATCAVENTGRGVKVEIRGSGLPLIAGLGPG